MGQTVRNGIEKEKDRKSVKKWLGRPFDDLGFVFVRIFVVTSFSFFVETVGLQLLFELRSKSTKQLCVCRRCKNIRKSRGRRFLLKRAYRPSLWNCTSISGLNHQLGSRSFAPSFVFFVWLVSGGWLFEFVGVPSISILKLGVVNWGATKDNTPYRFRSPNVSVKRKCLEREQ